MNIDNLPVHQCFTHIIILRDAKDHETKRQQASFLKFNVLITL
jgi:hypothetical protein